MILNTKLQKQQRGKQMDEKRFKEIMMQLLGRSGWEMLPAAMHSDSMATSYRTQGARMMERVWHEIIKEVMDAEITAKTKIKKKPTTIVSVEKVDAKFFKDNLYKKGCGKEIQTKYHNQTCGKENILCLECSPSTDSKGVKK